MANPWNPTQYERFHDERSQPFYDLLGLVQPCPGGRVLDLGCGTGELTAVLHRTAEAKETVGVDSSAAMLARSAAFAGQGLRFEQSEIEAFEPEQPFNLVFSNAALQWVDDHATLLPRIAAMVAGDGQLAVQVPDNDSYPSHALAKQVGSEEPFATAIGGFVRQWPVKAPEWYAETLDRLGFSEQSVSLHVYGHRLESRDGVVEWVKGTYLTEYEKRMDAEMYERYLARYRERLAEAFEDRRPFFYPFRRILMWARK